MSSVVVSRRARTAAPTPPADVALEYRPSAYFAPWSAPAIAAILRCGRRAAFRGIVPQSATIDEQPPHHSPLSEDVRRTLHRIHPSLTDGQFLPTLQPCETEIARITFASTTHDVTAVYARQRKGGVFYRVSTRRLPRITASSPCSWRTRRIASRMLGAVNRLIFMLFA